jgi:hypothetical protein
MAMMSSTGRVPDACELAAGAAARLGDDEVSEGADAAGDGGAVEVVSLDAAAAAGSAGGELAGGWLPPHAANDDSAM